MAKRVFLHVATPKSGTTYLQAVLWQNTEVLREAGLLLPGTFQTHYTAAKAVTKRRRMREVDIDITTAWSRLANQTNRWSADALICHELFAPASAEQAEAARSALDASETHLILTARALLKQVPAAWQQGLKGGDMLPFERFVRNVRDATGKGEWFWSVQDLGDVARRWGAGIPADRVHIVTVPPDSTDPTLLWRRYASVLGIDPGSCDVDVPKKNVSLGCAEAEVLRRVHSRRDARFRNDPERSYVAWTRKLLAVEILGERHGAPFGLPANTQEWIPERTAAMTSEIRDRGYHVVGDLADLNWQPPSPQNRLPSSVTDDEVQEVCTWTITRLREELVQRQPDAVPPAVGPDDGVDGILELLEHIRAADTGTQPRPARPARRPPSPKQAAATRRLGDDGLSWRRR